MRYFLYFYKNQLISAQSCEVLTYEIKKLHKDFLKNSICTEIREVSKEEYDKRDKLYNK